MLKCTPTRKKMGCSAALMTSNLQNSLLIMRYRPSSPPLSCNTLHYVCVLYRLDAPLPLVDQCNNANNATEFFSRSQKTGKRSSYGVFVIGNMVTYRSTPRTQPHSKKKKERSVLLSSVVDCQSSPVLR